MNKKIYAISAIALIFAAVFLGGIWVWEKNELKKIVEKERLAQKESAKKIEDEKKINSSTQKLFGLGSGYAYYGKDVYYEEILLEGADGSEFENLGGGFAKDRNTIFYNGTALKDVDAETFRKADEFLPIFWDKNQGYYLGEVMTLSDAKDLINFLSKDIGGKNLKNNYRLYKNKIYYRTSGPHAIPMTIYLDADPFSFKSFSNCPKGSYCINFGKDASKVFREYHKIEGADSNTFQILNSTVYSKDKTSVFYDYRKIEDIDPETFEILGMAYGKDRNNVYYLEYKLVDADPKTFEINKIFGLAKDKDNYYFRDKKITEEEFNKILKENNISK